MPKPRDHELLKRLGSRFRELRDAQGLTQEQVAEALGIQPLTASRWECGRAGLSFPLLVKAASLFGIGLGELVAIDNPLPASAHGRLIALWASLNRDQRSALLRLIETMIAR